MISSRSVWTQSSLATKLVAGGVVIVGFALFFFIEYIYGNKSGLLGSVLLALFLGVTCIVLAFLCIIQSIRVTQVKSRR